jgi:hypothetical protein
LSWRPNSATRPWPTRVVVFEPKSATPVALHVADKTNQYLALAYVPPKTEHPSWDIVYWGQGGVFGTLTSTPPAAEETQSETVSLAQTTQPSMLDALYGTRSRDRAAAESQDAARVELATKLRDEAMAKEGIDVEAERENVDTMGVASHVMPSVKDLFAPFMGGLMKLRISEVPIDEADKQQHTNEVEGSEAMDVDQKSPSAFTLEALPTVDAFFRQAFQTQRSAAPAASAKDEPSSESDNSESEEEDDPKNMAW